jgi:hygromycin-B 7''-O-kinase
VAERHGLPGARLRRERLGTNVVFGAGPRHLVKLFPPLWAGEQGVERAALGHVAGRLSVATPEVAAEGELEGWSYLVLTRVPGTPLVDVWGRLAPEARARAARRAGEILAEHHALELPGAGVPAPPWPAFVAERAEQARARLAGGPRTRAWAEALPRFLAPLLPELGSAPAAFLNADVTEEHLLLAGDGSGEVIGLVDLADAMVGAREYDLVSFAVFLGRRAELLGELLAGAGVGRGERGPALGRRLAAWALLHRYANDDALARLAGEGVPLEALPGSLFGDGVS